MKKNIIISIIIAAVILITIGAEFLSLQNQINKLSSANQVFVSQVNTDTRNIDVIVQYLNAKIK